MGASVRGAAHKRADLPNQDCINWQPGPSVILALSDGHGSRKCFRSDRGALFAVVEATTTLKDFIRSVSHRPGDGSLSAVKRMAEENAPKEIVRKWRAAVKQDIEWEPFSDDELKLSDGKAGYLSYGATLLTVLVTADFIIYLQLGDGDIVTVSENGEPERPLPDDDRLFANETTSFSAENAWRDFRFRFRPITDQSPVLILLSTDGYANSFQNDASFLKVGPDILEMIASEGPDFVKQHLESWLTEASEAGSGDDITVGVVHRIRIV